MSASLVGSEMCIRDSQYTPYVLWRSPCACNKSAATQRRGSRTVPRSTAAVSYTHLTLPTICSV
eukprot:15145179-Alexandrium_andersonii.AAC.1